MKIAILYPHLTGPYGGERLLINLVKELTKIGNGVTVYTHKIHPSAKTISQGIPIIEGMYPPIQNHDLSSFLDLVFMPLLLRKVNTDIDLLISIGWQSGFGAFWYKKVSGNKKHKTVYYCLEPPRIAHDLKNNALKKVNLFKKIFQFPVTSIIQLIDKISVGSFDHIISISDWTHDQIKNIYQKESTIIYPGIETSRFNDLSKKQAREILGIPRGQHMFISVSKLHHRKRLDLAINVFQEKQDSYSMFYIIGDGPDKEMVKEAIKNTSLSNIKLLGQLTDYEVALYMKAADFFIFTAQDEPFGIAPLEAKYAGCTIIPKDTSHSVYNWTTVAQKQQDLFKKIMYET